MATKIETKQTKQTRVARCPVFDRTVRFFGHLSGQKYDAKPDKEKAGMVTWKPPVYPAHLRRYNIQSLVTCSVNEF